MAKDSNGKAVRYLDLEMVQRLVQLRARIKRGRAAEGKLADKLKAKLSAGFKCPKSGPFTVYTLTATIRDVDWEAKFYRHLKFAKFNGDGKAARKFMNRIKQNVNPTFSSRLMVDKNPDWEEKSSRKKAA